MPAKTSVEKILSRVSGRDVTVGEIIFPEPELITSHDWYVAQIDDAMRKAGVTRFHAPKNVAFFTDHEPVAVSPAAAERQKKVREIAARFDVGHFFDVGRGGLGHIFAMETGLARPGLFASGYDTHITSYGAIGCFATAIVTEVSELLACGSVWLLVPRTVRIEMTGALRPGVYARDLAQHLIAAVPAETLDDAVVEFSGPAVAHMTMDDRIILVNTPMEVAARTGFFCPDDVMRHYCHERGISMDLAASSDPDADFAEVIPLDLSRVAPQIACPPVPDNSVPVTDVLNLKIAHAFIGSCAGGTISDLRVAAACLKGQTLADGVRLFITPATQKIAQQAAREGLWDIFISAGAVVTAAGCGPCAGGRIAPQAEGEVSLNTGTRNDYGRLGAAASDIFLASPATVACSAVAGHIVDPRDHIAKNEK